MSHQHDSCPKDGCVGGTIWGPCSWEDCPNDDCEVIAHCSCKCHSGKVCGCMYVWPRMEAKQKPKECQ